MLRTDVVVNLDELGAQSAIQAELDTLIRKVKLDAEGGAKVDAPVRTGFYKANIGKTPDGVVARANYSIHVERRRQTMIRAMQRTLGKLRSGGL